MDPDANASAASGHVLVVCTGNICRSPYIERLLAHELGGTGITVSSAGTGALVGNPVDPGSVSLLTASGVNAQDFAARQITTDMVREADLVIGATREHLGPVVQLAPRALRYSFALTDLSDLLDEVSDHDIDVAAGDNRVAKVAAAAISRRGTVNPRRPEESGIVDPFRRDTTVFTRMASQVGDSLPVIVEALRGP